MATSSGELARAALDGLVESGADFALLHGGDKLMADEGFSDVDVVVGRPPATVVADAIGPWKRLGLSPIVLWQYAVGGSSTVFLVTDDAGGGVQLDMLHDPDGASGYRLRSGALLDRAKPGDRYSEVDDAARSVYLWQKRRGKDQPDRLAEVLKAARRVPREVLTAAAKEITGSDDIVGAAHEGDQVTPLDMGRSLGDWRRLAGRLAHPIGCWVHAADRDLAEELERRLGRVLVVVGSGRVPSVGLVPWWYALRVSPVVFRPGAFVSWGGDAPALPRPHVMVEGEPDEAAREMVEALAARLGRCVS